MYSPNGTNISSIPSNFQPPEFRMVLVRYFCVGVKNTFGELSPVATFLIEERELGNDTFCEYTNDEPADAYAGSVGDAVHRRAEACSPNSQHH